MSTTGMSSKLTINVAILGSLCVALSVLADNFLDVDNFMNILRQVAVVAIVAAASTLVMVAGGLDLSVGGVAALSGVVAALLIQVGMPLGPAFLLGALTGALVGVVNAVLVVTFGLNSVIATLGTLYVCRGTANLLADGLPVRGLPRSYGTFGNGDLLGLPTPAVVMLLVCAVLTVVERRTLLGKYAVAIGSNLEAARLSGIKVARVRVALHVAAGAMAGLGGIIVSSRLNSGQPTAAQGLEFDCIVAAVLGGTSLAGGEGRVVGTLIGALIVGVVNNGLNLLGVESFWQTIVQGVILVVAVGIDAIVRHRNGQRPSFAALRRRAPPQGAPPAVGDGPSATLSAGHTR